MKRKLLHAKKHHRRLRYFLALVLFLTGILCFVFSHLIHSVLPYILSGLLFFLAADQLYEALKDKHFNPEDTDQIAYSIIFLALAIIVLIKPAESGSLIGAIWGILALLLAAQNISHSLYAIINREGLYIGHGLHLIHAAINIYISISLLLNPEHHLHFHVYILGLELMDYALRLAFEER